MTPFRTNNEPSLLDITRRVLPEQPIRPVVMGNRAVFVERGWNPAVFLICIILMIPPIIVLIVYAAFVVVLVPTGLAPSSTLVQSPAVWILVVPIMALAILAGILFRCGRTRREVVLDRELRVCVSSLTRPGANRYDTADIRNARITRQQIVVPGPKGGLRPAIVLWTPSFGMLLMFSSSRASEDRYLSTLPDWVQQDVVEPERQSVTTLNR
ncbi:MAG: hypothetical protein KIS87_09065 [Phycisphaeraceae bacterium]|nr:hypothetical protein [Phycisphaeraceae bacterium]